MQPRPKGARVDSTELSSHFQFGENWQSYAAMVDERRIAQAVDGLARLVPAKRMAGKTFLDIGSGSGLHMLSALRLGAAQVTGYDIDPNSVAASRSVLGRFAADQPWSVDVCSVFDMDPARTGTFDVVYSWGVLHHTGDMWTAIERAGALVKPDGLLVIALYRKTKLCGFWAAEKKLYAHASRGMQRVLRGVYTAAYFLRFLSLGRNPWRHVREYDERGMDWRHDVNDWLGGYPYESATPQQVTDFLATRGYVVQTINEHPHVGSGLFGTGCDEYVFRRCASDSV